MKLKKSISLMLTVAIITGLLAGCDSKASAMDSDEIVSPAVATITPQADEEPEVTVEETAEMEEYVIDLSGNAISESEMWTLLKRYMPNEYSVAAIMGVMISQSPYKANAVACYYLDKSRDICAEFTAEIDEGLVDGSSFDKFVYEGFGYGLLQLSTPEMRKRLYLFAQNWGTSIGDPEMQCAALVNDLKENYPKLYKVLLEAEDVYTPSIDFSIFYEGTRSEDARYSRYMDAESIYARQTAG